MIWWTFLTVYQYFFPSNSLQFPCAHKGKWRGFVGVSKGRLGRVFRFWRCKDKAKKVVPVRICPYLSDFVKKISKFLILSKIASCTPVFTKSEPRIGKSTTPQMDKWRPKTMRRAPKSRLFRPSAWPFFHQKRGRTALWIHWRTLQLIDFQCTKFWGCQGVKVSKCQTKCRARKFAYKLYLKYIYFKSSKRHIWWCTLTLWHFDTLTPCSIVAYAFPQKHRIW